MSKKKEEKLFLEKIKKDKEVHEIGCEVYGYVIDDGTLDIITFIDEINKIIDYYIKNDLEYMISIYSDRFKQKDIYDTKKLNTNGSGLLTLNTIDTFTIRGIKKDYYKVVFYEEKESN